MTELTIGQSVTHPRFGRGQIEYPKGATALVRFKHGIEECTAASLKTISEIEDQLRSDLVLEPKVLCRSLAEAILSVNDTWGVFSKSRISLLPHQLWVCHRVLRHWPTQFLIADDVGLGKTVEAGLILWPLLARGLVKRLLIICPASLVEQWQFRLRDMFDIRLKTYVPALDTPKSDFWNSNDQVVVSLQTIRDNHAERYKRLLAAEPWDLLIVDEAHHLNADKDTGATQGYRLVDQLVKRNLAQARLFFTGTPHRGKDYGFFALLHLLRPNEFTPRVPPFSQIPRLRNVLIRNNKQNVVDMQGKKLFRPIVNHPTTYLYSAEEAAFYELLTRFISDGRAYASTLESDESRAVILVLIAIQKLASSSIAAIHKAIDGRLRRLQKTEVDLQEARKAQKEAKDLLAKNAELSDLVSDEQRKYEEEILLLTSCLNLVRNEIPSLKKLSAAASAIQGHETKIHKILEVVREKYPQDNVLFFTEYKATQALLMSALIKEFGNACVTFINGDERIDGVIDAQGRSCSFSLKRQDAAEQFNAGKVRFLVSTEAAGEGIDLQESCHVLIHVDLPWNPMRLHQRVGRLNRYGQKKAVEVVTLRNPHTVESKIWEKLNLKIGNIMRSLGSAMDDPEDLLQLVLGVTEPSLFNHLFSEGTCVEPERLSAWFDKKTQTFGGRNAIETVQTLLGNSARFDLGDLHQIPTKDLSDLQPFFETMLSLNNRRVQKTPDGLSFKTPDNWTVDAPGVRLRYTDLVFSRELRGKDAALRILGVGHQAFDKALEQATAFNEQISLLPGIQHPISVWSIYDRITSQKGYVHQIVKGICRGKPLADWELIDLLNKTIRQKTLKPLSASCESDQLMRVLEEDKTLLRNQLPRMQLPFEIPEIRLVSVFVPGVIDNVSAAQTTANND